MIRCSVSWLSLCESEKEEGGLVYRSGDDIGHHPSLFSLSLILKE